MATQGTKPVFRSAISWKASAAVLWLMFSVALACWWLIFGLGQIDRISQLAGEAPAGVAAEIARRHRMLLSEGATLILLLVGGGVALLYHVGREAKRTRVLREFFAAFTHDLKTSLASLRLQAESLEEDLRESGHEKLMRRLVKDTVRLELQLENSLLLASPDDNSQFLLEPLGLRETLKPMVEHWPDLAIEIATPGDREVKVFADHRALESIFKNLLQNALVHGRSTKVAIAVERRAPNVLIRVRDNGRGFNGDYRRLGRIFERHATSSGSGLGLYLAANLAGRLGGALRLLEEGPGFGVEITLPEAE